MGDEHGGGDYFSDVRSLQTGRPVRTWETDTEVGTCCHCGEREDNCYLNQAVPRPLAFAVRAAMETPVWLETARPLEL